MRSGSNGGGNDVWKFIRDEVWPQRKEMGWGVWILYVALWITMSISDRLRVIASSLWGAFSHPRSLWHDIFWKERLRRQIEKERAERDEHKE